MSKFPIIDGFPLRLSRKRPEKQWMYKYIARWQNNSPGNLGVIRYAYDLFSFLNPAWGLPRWLPTSLEMALEYKVGDTKVDRCSAICTYREGSKTSWYGKIIPLYFITMSEYGIYWEDTILPPVKFIRLRGKTFDESSKKADLIRMELNNERVIKCFGELKPTYQEVRKQGYKDNLKILIMKNDVILLPFGLDQPSRGHNIRDNRPDLDINDDVENKENTKTALSRKYNEDEVLGEQFGGLAKHGSTWYIFNMVHDDCLGKRLLDNPSWKRTKHSITYFDKDNVERADWPGRFPVEYVHKLKKWYEGHPGKGGLKIFYREFYNKIVSDADYQVISYKGKYVRKAGHNWINKVRDNGEEEMITAYIVVSADPAISKDKRASDGAVIVNAFCSDKQRRIITIKKGKFEIRDRYYKGAAKYHPLAVTREQLLNVEKRGMVEDIVRYILWYNADAFVIENAGQQLAWYDDVRNILRDLGISPLGLPYVPKDEKIYKLKVGLMKYFSGGFYELREGMPYYKDLEEVVNSFPDTNYDILDAIHNSEKMRRFPAQLILTHAGTTESRDSQSFDPDAPSNPFAKGKRKRRESEFHNPMEESGEAWMITG